MLCNGHNLALPALHVGGNLYFEIYFHQLAVTPAFLWASGKSDDNGAPLSKIIHWAMQNRKAVIVIGIGMAYHQHCYNIVINYCVVFLFGMILFSAFIWHWYQHLYGIGINIYMALVSAFIWHWYQHLYGIVMIIYMVL